MDYLNDILAALSVGMDSLFPKIPCYAEWVPDELPPECFLIGFTGETAARHEPGARISVTGKLDITYLPPKKSQAVAAKRLANKVYAKLALELRVIRYGEMALRLGKHTRSDTGDVLHDLCGFTAFLIERDGAPKISEIKIKET